MSCSVVGMGVEYCVGLGCIRSVVVCGMAGVVMVVWCRDVVVPACV